ncbi:unnamed protein product [Vitrella brassicaformis CCMP3155]|uniref:Uncharacterized protein n=1 Tax=Vitrella brassicaformis (strain CCMP3155) TaxID=1169540 RepID=A0A0G4FM29_VITBC|nr:unnamed protein product [Vitrella brassicaformis CCMP3155]|eukprot:CEM14867.1 unnamed protein product [Vitrella brassicaformis CCMP3155]
MEANITSAKPLGFAESEPDYLNELMNHVPFIVNVRNKLEDRLVEAQIAGLRCLNEPQMIAKCSEEIAARQGEALEELSKAALITKELLSASCPGWTAIRRAGAARREP